jgi:hypothetical protein
VKPHCVFIRTTTPIDDVHLLGDVADAFKHHKLGRKSATITGANAIVTLGSGYGEMHFGEGNVRCLDAAAEAAPAAGQPVLAGVVLVDGHCQTLRSVVGE